MQYDELPENVRQMLDGLPEEERAMIIEMIGSLPEDAQVAAVATAQVPPGLAIVVALSLLFGRAEHAAATGGEALFDREMTNLAHGIVSSLALARSQGGAKYAAAGRMVMQLAEWAIMALTICHPDDEDATPAEVAQALAEMLARKLEAPGGAEAFEGMKRTINGGEAAARRDEHLRRFPDEHAGEDPAPEGDLEASVLADLASLPTFEGDERDAAA